MTTETDLFATLAALAPAGGVWGNHAPDAVLPPYVVFARVGSVPELALLGDRPALTRVRMQIDCYALIYEDAKTLAESVKTAMLAAPFKNVIDSDQDLYESDVKLHRVTMDFFCWQ